MRNFFVVTALFFCNVLVNAQAKKTVMWQNDNGVYIETSKPIFLFEKEHYNFGEIVEGMEHEIVFKFKNIGYEPLILKDVKAACGCTIPEWSKVPVMPGQSGEIKVVYDARNRIGYFDKSITITSNSVEPSKQLIIKGTVIEEAATKPVSTEEESPAQGLMIQEGIIDDKN